MLSQLWKLIGNRQPPVIKSIEIRLWRLLFDIVSTEKPILDLLVTALEDISAMGIDDPEENCADWFTASEILPVLLN
jgi:hypothetical protein